MLGASGLSLAVLLAFLLHAAAHGTPTRLAAAALLLAWGLSLHQALRQWRDAPIGQLAWTHGGWQWIDPRGEAHAIALELVWDAQDHSLLRCRAAHAAARALLPPASPTALPDWLWLERRMAPASWSDLRRALHFHAAVPQAR